MGSPLQIGQALIEHTSLTSEALATAIQRQEESGQRLTRVLLELELVTEAELLQVLSQVYQLPLRADVKPGEIDADLATRVPISFAKAHGLLPARQAGEAIEVLVSDPLLTDPLDDLRFLFPALEIRPVLATERAILNCINTVFDRGSAEEVAATMGEQDLDDLASEVLSEPEDLLDSSDDGAPIIRLVNSLLQQAVKERASDIHVEPYERELVVRFRTDDVMYEPIRRLPKRVQNAVISRIKIMGRLDIAERRLPQDGRIQLKIAGKDYDVRLSVVPTQHGERCVLRLLPRTQELLQMSKIGLTEQDQRTLDRLIHRTTGIILVTGPTGSGKTTTLYASLAEINTPEHNIITIEDPVEISLAGVSQIEVRPNIGLSFAAGLRSILRQDPNVILVGEIRDVETAEIAIHASLTGHLVFSTIHTNDAAGAITRLVDMGIEPFLISSSLVASLAQRLVRILCEQCREPYALTPEEIAELGLEPEGRIGQTVFRAVGCPHCHSSGYYGRVAIYEILVVSDDIRQLIGRGVDSNTITDVSVRQGMTTLRLAGAQKVLEGITSVSEILRQTEEDTLQAVDPVGA
jgi:general secretion pathway protein E